jgi:hypothetical protein
MQERVLLAVDEGLPREPRPVDRLEEHERPGVAARERRRLGRVALVDALDRDDRLSDVGLRRADRLVGADAGRGRWRDQGGDGRADGVDQAAVLRDVRLEPVAEQRVPLARWIQLRWCVPPMST